MANGDPHGTTATEPVVVLADDRGRLRRVLHGMLAAVLPNWRAIPAGHQSAVEAILRAGRVDLLLADLRLPGLGGIPGLRALRAARPGLPIAAMANTLDRDAVLQALGAGINGFVLVTGEVDELGYALAAILGGHVYVPPQMLLMPNGPAPLVLSLFTGRQMDVLRLLAQGWTNKAIARELGLGAGTVKIHLAAVFRLLGAANRTAAAVLAERLELNPRAPLPRPAAPPAARPERGPTRPA